VKLRTGYVRLRCAKCHRTLDWYWHTGDGSAYTTAPQRKRADVGGPNGPRITYTCKCGATPELLTSRLLPLVPTAHRERRSISTDFLLI
jgi:hypothetical protein